MNKKVQISESIELGILLALSGGFMDAYSYIGRGGVFANAQTGNMLLLGVHLSEGDIPDAIRYLCPVLAFTFGIALSDIVRNLGKGGHLHWRQISVVTEAIILAIVSFFPQSHNLLANSLTSPKNSWKWYCYNHVYRKSSKRYTKYLHFLPDKETGFS